jgi:Ca-activated chloride channel homolog
VFALSTPWALSIVALAGWLLWRARRPKAHRTHTVSNLFLWLGDSTLASAAGVPDRPRPPWLVWLQALILVALALAAAGPRRPSTQRDAALVIDVSRSMGARETGGTRLDLARAAARTWLHQRPPRSSVAIVAAGQHARTVGDFRAADPAADAALAALVTEPAPADFVGAITAARAATSGPVAVVSDAVPTASHVDAAVEWLRVGGSLNNVGIVSVRPGSAGRALVEVANFGATPQAVSLSLDRDQQELWRQSFTIASGGSRAFSAPMPAGTRRVIARLHVDEPAGDALASDDELTSDVSPLAPVRVLLVTSGNRYIEQALRALPDIALDIRESLPSPLPTATLVVCDGCSTAPPRPSLWLPRASTSPSDESSIAVMRADHALLRGVDLSDIRVAPTSARTGAMTVLASAAGRPLIAADETSAGRQAVLNVDLQHSSLPLTVAFPIFISNTVAWLSDRPSSGLSESTAAAIAESDLREPSVVSLDAVPTANLQPPRPLLDIVAGAALLLVALEWLLRRDRGATRLVAAAAIIGAIIGARIPGCASGRTVMFAVDGSASVASIRRTTIDRVRAEIGAMSPNDRAGLVVFGSRGDQLRAPDTAPAMEGVTWPAAGAATNIAAGIDAARRSMPADGDRRIVLLSDGQPTAGDTLSAALAAHAPIDVIPLDDHGAPVIRRLDAPIESRTGLAVRLRADVEGAPGTRITIDLSRDDVTIDTRTIALDPGGRGSMVWTDTPSHAGVVFYRAAVMDPRLGIVVSEAGAGVTVGGRTRALLVSDDPGGVSPRLRSAELDLDQRTAAALPDTRGALAPYGVIVLDAVAPHRLNARQRDAIADAVALDGAGLLVLGSRESLGAADYAASRYTDALPIDFTTMPRPPTASMALALLVDTSGSMASTSDGVTKISAARDAVSRALTVLPASDTVQVIGFSSTPTVLVAAGDPRDPATIAERLRAMAPGGGTALTPALTQAMTWLRGVANPIRRVLLVSDGRTTPADAESARAAVKDQGIEVSVVAIGGDADRPWLTGLAQTTRGRAYFPETLRDLPRDVAREAARGTSGREVDERFRVRAGLHPLAPTAPPELGGYVAGQLRPGAIAAWKSSTEDPVLAAWPHGLGRVAVFASDLRGPWGAPLASWSEAPAFWHRAVSWLSRASDAAGADAQLETTAAGTRLIVDTGLRVDDDALPSVSASLVTPSGTTMSLPLHAVTADRAEAALALGESGDYRATIVVSDPRTGRETRFMRGWYWSGDLEAQARGVNLPLLQEIAARSGGVLRPAGARAESGMRVFDGPRTRASAEAAVVLLLLAVALLFWDYSRALSREAHR